MIVFYLDNLLLSSELLFVVSDQLDSLLSDVLKLPSVLLMMMMMMMIKSDT